jgi:hypothetical protein
MGYMTINNVSLHSRILGLESYNAIFIYHGPKPCPGLIETIKQAYEYGEQADWQSVPYLGRVCRNKGKDRHRKYWINNIIVGLASIMCIGLE